MPKHFSVAIIGAGPGGLGAAARAAKVGVSHILFEKNEIGNTIFNYQLRKHVMAEPGKLPLRSDIDFQAGTREQILDTWNKTVNQLNVNWQKAEVTKIIKNQNIFEIHTANEVVQADNVILAIGMQGSPRLLEVEGANLPHVAYTLSDPDAFSGKNILVIGAGDAAIENALALCAKNNVYILNRTAEFARAKDANVALIMSAINSGQIKCFSDSELANITQNTATITTPEGDVTIECDHIIARIGCIMPRKFLETIGIKFPNSDPMAVPVVSNRYESNVSNLFIVGALIGYPLIKQAINQGYEVIEHIRGNPIKPADQGLLEDKLKELSTDVDSALERLQTSLPFYQDLSSPQFRELILESKIHIKKRGEVIFKRNDYTDTFFGIVEGSVEAQVSESIKKTLNAGVFFGEMGLISGRRRTATVIINSENCVLIETPRKQILKLISSVDNFRAIIDRTFLLRSLQTSIFPDSDSETLEKLLDKIQFRKFKKGEVLFREGDIGEHLFVIRKGSVKVSRLNSEGHDVVQTYIPAGNYVGEMALMTSEPTKRSATVSAVVPCETILISKEDFLSVLTSNPKEKQKITQLATSRKVENILSDQTSEHGDLLDFIFTQGVTDADNFLMIDSDLCVSCDNCEAACAATHNGYSRLDRKGGKSFASVQIPISCRHCENPLCMLDCPPDALTRQPNGEVVIRDTCIGCGNCQRNCPYGVIQMVYDSGNKLKGFSLFDWFRKEVKEKGPAKAAKCDMCYHLDGGPACVRSCPTGAALRVNPNKLLTILRDKDDI
jgi:CRP-like cAMP-binding protein/thioredoxin reductase/Fe-S-cluster-containing hydrogenase component 2